MRAAKRVVVLGAGTGGTLAANRLRRAVGGDEAEIVVVDADDRHIYQPGLLFVPFGLARPADLVRARRAQLRPGIEFRRSAVDHVDLDADRVFLAEGPALSYDVLVVASGTQLLPEETEGLTGPGWGKTVHTFYSFEEATTLGAALARFEGGRLVVNVIDMPIKCPVAPLEFCFLADWYFQRRGIRDEVKITYVTSLDGAFTKATCNRELSGLLAEKGVEVVTEFNTSQVDGEAGRLVSFDEREVGFDLAVVVPLHGGASSPPTALPGADRRCMGGRDRRPAKGADRVRGGRGGRDHPVPPRPAPWDGGAVVVDDLAGAAREGLRDPPAPQAAPKLLEALCR